MAQCSSKVALSFWGLADALQLTHAKILPIGSLLAGRAALTANGIFQCSTECSMYSPMRRQHCLILMEPSRSTAAHPCWPTRFPPAGNPPSGQLLTGSQWEYECSTECCTYSKTAHPCWPKSSQSSTSCRQPVSMQYLVQYM